MKSWMRFQTWTGWKSRKIDITYPRSEGADGLAPALNRICQEVEQAIADGYSILFSLTATSVATAFQLVHLATELSITTWSNKQSVLRSGLSLSLVKHAKSITTAS